MKNEIEIKILEIDKKRIERVLISLEAEKVFDDIIHAIYYDYEDRSIRAGRGTCRLRREGERAFFTFKKDIESGDAKVCEEKEVEVSDFSLMQEILVSLGLSPWLEMKKHRISYHLDGLCFELDTYHDDYSYIPEFLEIEGPDILTIRRYAELLGFSAQDCRPWNALQVAEFYSRTCDSEKSSQK